MTTYADKVFAEGDKELTANPKQAAVANVASANATEAVAGAAAATIDTGVVGDNNALTWTAKDLGFAGNGISVALVDPAGNNQAIAVNVADNNISVSLATDGAGAITSTAANIITAIEANAAANALVSVANTGASTGAGVVAAVAATNLAGGKDGEAPTVAQYNTLVALANENKAQLNAALAALRTAGIITA